MSAAQLESLQAPFVAMQLSVHVVFSSRENEGVVHEFTVSTGIDHVSVHNLLKSAPGITLWRNFFPEPVLPKASSQELSLGYAGNASVVILGSFQAWMRASLDSHIFETSTPKFTASVAPDS